MSNLKELTNAFVVDSGRILLGLKKRGFGAGKWNGFGGKLEAGESALEGAQREFQEEAFVQMVDPMILGKVSYTYRGMEKKLAVYVVKASKISPEIPKESEEMRPEWFPVDQVPFHSMWADDEYWYTHLLAGTRFMARFDFDSDMQTILSKTVLSLDDDEPFKDWL